MDNLKFKNITFYSFFKPCFDLEVTRTIIYDRMCGLKVKGTILLAEEGINCSLSGAAGELDEFIQFLHAMVNIAQAELKISYSKEITFKRSVVKVKEHIIPDPGKTPIELTQDPASRISPEIFHQWIKENKKMVVLDTRNDFEYQAGRFKNSHHLGTRHFADFEEDLQNALPEWQHTPVVTLCTGGVRCEKAAPLMVKKGFQEVYQLDGGILNYFKKIGRGYFEGECFVFDERVGISPASCGAGSLE